MLTLLKFRENYKKLFKKFRKWQITNTRREDALRTFLFASRLWRDRRQGYPKKTPETPACGRAGITPMFPEGSPPEAGQALIRLV